MQPADYNIDVQSPFLAAVQGYQAGAGIRNDMAQQAQLEQQRQQQLQMQQDLAALAGNSNASSRDYAAMTLKYPQLREQFKQGWDMLNSDQQRSALSQMSQVYAATLSGRPDLAEQLLRESAAAKRNSGLAPEARAMESWADLVKSAPDQAKNIIGLRLASVMDPDKFAATYTQLGDEGRKAALAPSELAKSDAEARIKQVEAANAPTKVALDNSNVRSQIDERAARLSLDRDRLTSDVQLKLHELGQKANTLDDGAKKIVNDSTVAAVAADQSASQTLDLADRFESLGGGNGGFATTAEAWAKLTGRQDAMTAARQEYTRLRSSQVSKMLPPGPASDKDIQLALEGFPPANADSKYIASFLRGMAKLQQYDAVSNSAKAEWVNAVGHLGKPKSDIEIDGVKVPAGSTFVDFSREFMSRKADELAAAHAVKQVQSRPYMRFAQPGAPAATSDQPATSQQASPAGTSAPQAATEMDAISEQLAALEPSRRQAKQEVDAIERDIAAATSLRGRQHVDAATVREMRARHDEAASRLADLDAQISRLNARGRTASMAPAVPAQFQALREKYSNRSAGL